MGWGDCRITATLSPLGILVQLNLTAAPEAPAYRWGNGGPESFKLQSWKPDDLPAEPNVFSTTRCLLAGFAHGSLGSQD